jgi:hypothetical protein
LSRAGDKAWEDWKQHSPDCFLILQDLIDAYIPESKASKISKGDMQRLCKAFEAERTPAFSRHFNLILHVFHTAATRAWEEAYFPEDRHVDVALAEAVESAINAAKLPYCFTNIFLPYQSPKDWSPDKKFTEQQFYDEIDSGISYYHDPDRGERFLVFDIMDGPAVNYAKKRLKSLADETGQPANICAADFELFMKGQFVGPVVDRMRGDLQDYVSTVEPRVAHMRSGPKEWSPAWGHPTFYRYWKQVLEDKSYAKGVENEIFNWLKENPA